MKNTFDIVALIEKNPNTRLSRDYQNELINKIKKNFAEKEQQLFIGSFYCYLNHNCKKDFIIDLNDVWKWIGFARKDHAKRSLEKYFVENIDYEILLPRTEEQDYKILLPRTVEKEGDTNEKQNSENHGGHNKEKILMTINTFKKFCLKADTKKADEIHDYYIKLEELLHETINEQTDDMQNQLCAKDDALKAIDTKHKLELKMNKHNILVEKMKNRKCVYIGEIEDKTDNNIFFKIGSSNGIDGRYPNLVRTFDNFIFLEVFECEKFREVEINILSDTEIKKHQYTKKINGHASREVIQLSDEFNYQYLLTIVKKYVSQIYSDVLTPEQSLEKQKIDFENKKLDFEKQKLDHEFLMNVVNNKLYTDVVKKELSGKLLNFAKIIEQNINDGKSKKDDTDNKMSLSVVEKPPIVFADNTPLVTKMARMKNSKKIQKIDPNNLKKIVAIYDNISQALRSPENKGFDITCLSKAIKNNTLYKDFRWNYVNKDEDPNVCNIQPTQEFKQKQRFVCTILKLNSTKTKILDSYATRHEIAKNMKISTTTLNKIIENGEKYKDHYYIKSTQCPQILIDEYGKAIPKYIHSEAKQIKQINPLTNQSVVFICLADIYRKYGITAPTIRKAIKTNTVCNGFLWEHYVPVDS